MEREGSLVSSGLVGPPFSEDAIDHGCMDVNPQISRPTTLLDVGAASPLRIRSREQLEAETRDSMAGDASNRSVQLPEVLVSVPI